MSNILAILLFAGALSAVLMMIKKDLQTGEITIYRRGSAASVCRAKSPILFWFALCSEGLVALVLLGGLSFNIYLALAVLGEHKL